MHSPSGFLNENHTDLGDCIGVESCVDLKSNIDVVENCVTTNTSNKKQHRFLGLKREEEKTKGKDFPPRIPYVPWVMKKYHTSDGRLIIKEERVEHRHEYFQAHRANGRLTLCLVPFNDAVFNDNDHDNNDNEDDGNERVHHADEEGVENNNVLEARISECEETDGADCKGKETVRDDLTVEMDHEVKSKTNLSEFGGLSKCYSYDTAAAVASSTSSSSSLFNIAVAEIRPVHI